MKLFDSKTEWLHLIVALKRLDEKEKFRMTDRDRDLERDIYRESEWERESKKGKKERPKWVI